MSDKTESEVGNKKSYSIIINAREKQWFEESITFEQLVVLSHGAYHQNDSTIYTITYKNGTVQKPEGSMVSGDIIQIKDKIIFNVTTTNRS